MNTSSPLPVPPPKASCCPLGGIWSPWSRWSNCSTPCGACSNATRTRVCGSAPYGCPCNMSSVVTTSETLPCNRHPCTFPNNSCCSPSAAVPVTGGSEILCGSSTEGGGKSKQKSGWQRNFVRKFIGLLGGNCRIMEPLGLAPSQFRGSKFFRGLNVL